MLQDEHADQLRGLAQLSALLASFGIIAFIQFGFDATQLPRGLLLMFAIANALTVRLCQNRLLQFVKLRVPGMTHRVEGLQDST